jgi:ribonuclease J
VTLIIDEDGLALGDAWADTLGLPEQGRSGPLVEALETGLSAELDRADRRMLASDERLTEALRRRVRSITLDEIGKKPEVSVVVSRLAEE